MVILNAKCLKTRLTVKSKGTLVNSKAHQRNHVFLAALLRPICKKQ